MKKRKSICVIIAICFLVSLFYCGEGMHTEAATAKAGWVKTSGGYKYRLSSGKYVKSQWKKINGKKYRFNAKGIMQTGWKKIGGKTYYFNAKGAMQTGWQKIGGKTYYFNAKGVMQTGWKIIGGKKYRFNAKGVMQVGWKKIGGKKYLFSWSGALSKAKILSKNTKVGDTVVFGVYEQDNVASNGKEPVEWLVLDKDSDGKLLLISKYGLECKQFNKAKSGDSDHAIGAVWKNSSVRKWLNGTFYKVTFSGAEKKLICKSKLENEGNFGEGYSESTTDKVFLLNCGESREYFKDDPGCDKDEFGWGDTSAERSCIPTAHAKARGAYGSEDYEKERGTCEWWLRTVSDGPKEAMIVDYYGGSNDHYVNNKHTAVRPAIWVQP